MNYQTAINNYKSQLNNRFYSNSISLEVLICLILIFILIIQIIKFFKKTYEWQADYQMKADNKYIEESRSILKQKSQIQGIVITDVPKNDQKKQQQPPKSRDRIKKEIFVPPIIKIQQIIKNKIPQIAIIAINVAMIASYQFCAIISYVSIVIIVISEIVGSEHVNLKFGLQIISKVLLITLYINIFTVPKPNP